MTATATLCYTSSRAEDNAVRIARVAAAGRVEAARRAAQRAEAEQYAASLAYLTEWVAVAEAEGAVRVGHKICFEEGGKWRGTVAIEDAAVFLAPYSDAEFWGITAEGEYVGLGY